MSTEFLAANPEISKDQMEKLEVLENPEHPNKALFDSKNVGCSFVWVRDEGRYAVMRSTMYSCVIVSHVRNGKITSRISLDIPAGHELSLLQNNDGLNYDGYVCC
jgi:hypothetical protein